MKATRCARGRAGTRELQTERFPFPVFPRFNLKSPRVFTPALSSSPRTSAENPTDRKSTRLNSSHSQISYAVFCLKKKKKKHTTTRHRQKKKLVQECSQLTQTAKISLI